MRAAVVLVQQAEERLVRDTRSATASAVPGVGRIELLGDAAGTGHLSRVTSAAMAPPHVAAVRRPLVAHLSTLVADRRGS